MNAQDAPPRAHLLRVLGLAFGLATVVGGVVGQGIFRTPGIVAGALPNEILILAFWLVGGALATMTAFALVELATSIPRAGGPYTFASRAFSPFAGTLTGWIDWLAGIVAIAYFAVVFAEYLQRLGLLVAVPVAVLAVTLIVAITAINWMGTRASGISQTIGSALKGLGLLLLVGLLFAAPEAPATATASSASPQPLTLAAVALALRAIVLTYGGWNAAAYFSEEIRAPERNMARSVFGGIALVTALYVLVNAAMLHVLSPEQIATSKLPAEALGMVLGSRADLMVNMLALVSVAAIANLHAMFLSRVGFAMARNGVLPALFARVSPTGTPQVALVVTTFIAAVFAASGSYEQLIAIAFPLTISIDIGVNSAAIAMRLREPDLARPFRMPLFPLPAVLGLILSVLLLGAVIYEDPFNSLLGLVTIAVIGLIYKSRALLLHRHKQ